MVKVNFEKLETKYKKRLPYKFGDKNTFLKTGALHANFSSVEPRSSHAPIPIQG